MGALTTIGGTEKPGDIKFHAASSIPAGWIKANGALVSRSAYGALFAVIGATYGAGDGATTFALPDLRGEFVRGFDDGRGIDPGRVFATTQDHQFQDHQHTTAYGAAGEMANGLVPTTATAEDATTLSRAASTGLRGAETRPRNVAMLACIKF